MEEAVKDYSQVIELDPKNPIYYCKRGIIYEKLKKWEEACKDHSKAIELDPKNPFSYFNRGNTYYN